MSCMVDWTLRSLKYDLLSWLGLKVTLYGWLGISVTWYDAPHSDWWFHLQKNMLTSLWRCAFLGWKPSHIRLGDCFWLDQAVVFEKRILCLITYNVQQWMVVMRKIDIFKMWSFVFSFLSRVIFKESKVWLCCCYVLFQSVCVWGGGGSDRPYAWMCFRMDDVSAFY